MPTTNRAVTTQAIEGHTAVQPAIRDKLPWVAGLFLFSLIIPWIIELGALRLSVSRFILIATILPCPGHVDER